MNNTLICFNDYITFNETFVFEDENSNVAIIGTLNSEHDITFKVKNLIIFGDIFCNNFYAHTKVDFVHFSGKMKSNGDIVAYSENYCIQCGKDKSEKALQIIKDLGIELEDASEQWNIKFRNKFLEFKLE